MKKISQDAASFVREIELHLAARYPLVFVVSSEEERAISLVELAVERAGMRFVRCPTSLSPGCNEGGSGDPRPTVRLVTDVHRRLDEPDVLRGLLDIGAGGPDELCVVVAPWVDLPAELERSSAVVELPLPDVSELGEALEEACAVEGVPLSAEDAVRLARAAQGMGLAEARRSFLKAVIGSPANAADARVSVERDKRKALRRSRVLETVTDTGGIEAVGGLDRLKAWLVERREAFSQRAREYGLPAPRGLLLMGVQGCGKSLTAKAVAEFWQLPLVRLDLSAVFGQPHPEEALRGALRIAEAMAPMVLWIDEIEKGFDRDAGGVGARLLGGFVTWLQEKSREVFVVATANRVADLPPELPRKGRFDEVFFVDLPSPQERREILAVHFRKRGMDPERYDLEGLVRRTDRFTGSELEQLVIAGMYAAFSRGEAPDDGDFAGAASEAVTLYETFESDIKALREWARKRARSASTDRRKLDYFEADTGIANPGDGGVRR